MGHLFTSTGFRKFYFSQKLVTRSFRGHKIFVLLFASLDTSGTWNVNAPATMTSTGGTYSASLGLENFILAKNWSQDPLFVVTSFLSFLSMSSEISTGHVFHLYRLIFSMVTSFVLLSDKKYQKNKKEKVKISPKNNDNPKIEKKERGKRGIISRGAHREGQSEMC